MIVEALPALPAAQHAPLPDAVASPAPACKDAAPVAAAPGAAAPGLPQGAGRPAQPGAAAPLGTGDSVVAALEAQLFHSAQDLSDLVAEHSRLQRRYQAVLEMYGESVYGQDQFLDYVHHPDSAHLVTDPEGRISQVSRAAAALLGESGLALQVADMAGLVQGTDAAADVELLLEQTRMKVVPDAVVHCRLALADGAAGPAGGRRFDALVVPLRRADELRLFWLLAPVPAAPADDPMAALRTLLLSTEDHCGVMLVDPAVQVTDVNWAFTATTGHEAAAVIGRNPSLLSAGRHSAEFFRAFWSQLRRTGSWTGHMYNRRRDGHIYAEWKTVKVVRNLAGELLSYVSRSIDSGQRETSIRELSRLALYDSVTGLPNRRLLDERLTQCIDRQSLPDAEGGFCVLFIDLDGFKRINDEHGHDVGDVVLQQVAQRLKAGLSRGDTVARNGGDEFVVLLPRVRRSEDAHAHMTAMLASIAQPLLVGDLHLSVNASIGCSRFPVDGRDGHELIKAADMAMYRAKHRGGAAVCTHEGGGGEAALRQLGQEVWGAAERGELHLVYQPQVHAAMPQRLYGCEALLRWRHPRLGELTPAAFIGRACDSGAIVGVGAWVLETVCQELRRWQARQLGPILLSINVAERELRDAGFADTVRRALERHGVAPAALQIEVDERDLQRLDTVHVERLAALRQDGLRLAVDHFGAGGTSVKRLQSLGVSQLKIDRHFVAGVVESADARAVMNCLIGLGTALNVDVVAEGVENEAQLDVLVGLGCPIVQGHAMGKPMSAPAFAASAFWQQRFGISGALPSAQALASRPTFPSLPGRPAGRPLA
jgi:diguanylate cyclase (GGDEF)-like protein/PAS domain S-box-containing protein